MEISSIPAVLFLAALPVGIGGGFFVGGVVCALTGYLQLFLYSWNRWPDPGIHAWKLLGAGTATALLALVPVAIWGLPIIELIR